MYPFIIQNKERGFKMKNKKLSIRNYVQLLFFSLIALISVNHTLNEKGISLPFIPNASLHAVCPFGGVVTLYEYFTTGSFIKKIHESSFILMIIIFISTIALGAVFCGWVCPFGSFQEFLSKIGKNLFKNKYNHMIPEKLDKYLRNFRYLVLIAVIYVTAKSGKIVFSEVDPYHALFNFWSNEVAIGSIIILLVTIAFSLIIERPWCKYACPYGAILGFANLFKIIKIHRSTNTCINCKACSKNCPMNIDVHKNTTITNTQCISCMKCTSEISCPISDTIILGTKGGINNEA